MIIFILILHYCHISDINYKVGLTWYREMLKQGSITKNVNIFLTTTTGQVTLKTTTALLATIQPTKVCDVWLNNADY